MPKTELGDTPKVHSTYTRYGIPRLIPAKSTPARWTFIETGRNNFHPPASFHQPLKLTLGIPFSENCPTSNGHNEPYDYLPMVYGYLTISRGMSASSDTIILLTPTI